MRVWLLKNSSKNISRVGLFLFGGLHVQESALNDPFETNGGLRIEIGVGRQFRHLVGEEILE
ncbi:MAG: hypothetical protein BWY66_00949 [bacterium ADurb.Bin374]|nr:MAG: hypothetical protein BWY66_00949 [bacterium ADurb.Bin374]